MRKIFLVFLIILLQFSFLPSKLYAQSSNCQITQEPPTLIQNLPPLTTTVPEDQRWFKFRIVVSDTAQYKVVFPAPVVFVERSDLTPDSAGVLRQSNTDLPGLQYQANGSPLFSPNIAHNFYIEKSGVPGHYCDGSYTIQADSSGGILECNLNFTPPNPDETQQVTLSGTIRPEGNYAFSIPGRSLQRISVDASGTVSSVNIGRFNPGPYQLTVKREDYDINGALVYFDTNCKFSLNVGPAGSGGSITPIGSPGPGGTGTTPVATPCTDPDKCTKAGGSSCSKDDPSRGPGFQTAIGCIHTSPVEFTKDFMKFILGIGGGFAFLMMLLGAFQMLTSAGNPETLAAGKDRLTSAIIGLLFVIFAVLLLQIIGFDILRLPGFDR